MARENFFEIFVNQIIFNDEKDFWIDSVPVNMRNARIYSKEKKKCDVDPSHLVLQKSKFWRKLMVWAGVSKRGKTRLSFIEPKIKFNKKFYVSVLKKANKILVDFTRTKTTYFNIITPHTVKYTIQWMQSNLPDFIFLEEWPPCSPDLNPLDFYVWGALQELVYKFEIKNIQNLKRRISWA